MGGSELIGPIFFGIFFLLLYFLATRNVKKEDPLLEKKEEVKRALPPKKKAYKKAEPLKKIPEDLYKAPDRRIKPILKKGWNKKDSLKQAFILSEVFKRYDEH